MERNPIVSEAVRVLMAMPDEVVSAKYIAPILRMSPDVIIKRAKDGEWDQDNLGKFVLSGDRVKFFRKDFLQKCGFMDPEPEEDSTDKLILKQLIEVNEGIRMICQQLTLMMSTSQLSALKDLIEEKEAAI